MKTIFFALSLTLSSISIAQDIYSGTQLERFRADSFDAEVNKTFFVIDGIAGKNIYTFKFLAKPDTRLSSIVRKVLGPTGLPQPAQDAHCVFSKTLTDEESQEDWKVYNCELVPNKIATYPTWYE
jgi:hypothetical protein